MNAEVIKSLSNLADTLSKLDERNYYTGSLDGDDDTQEQEQEQEEQHLVDATAAISLSTDNDDQPQLPQIISSQQVVEQPAARQCQSITYWRNLPTEVQAAYTLLTNGADYIHATSTKYTLVSKVDSTEGANLSLELRKGAQHIGTGTLLLFSRECGSSRSLRHYVKQASRGVILSLLSLLRLYEEEQVSSNVASKSNSNNDNNDNDDNVGAQKTGAVWSACDALRLKLPRGNRTAMRRELMIWVRDCNESIEEFEDMLELGPRHGNNNNNDDDDDDEEEQFEGKEMKMARAAVNIMKCSKNTLGLVLKVCECVGESLDETKVDSSAANQELLQMISDMHEVARRIGEGVTNFGVMLYPPLESAASSNNDEEFLTEWESVKQSSRVVSSLGGGRELEIPSLGSTSLGLQLEQQLYSLAECVLCIKNSKLTTVAGEPVQSCYSDEVNDAVAKLMTAIPLRCKEAVGGVTEWSA